jgi:GNAT superfamily N-acetyltransferase
VTVEIHPATADRFADVATIIGPRDPDANVCWCLSHRVDSRTNRELRGRARGAYVEELCRRPVAPGVLAYEGPEEPPGALGREVGFVRTLADGGDVVGWAAVAPRSELPFARSRLIPHVDDLPVWTAWCFRVRPGHRRRGVAHALLTGAVAYAQEQGAPAVEGYPVDNRGEKVDLTMAFVGTRGLFEAAGFAKAADTTAIAGGFPRVLMRLSLR